VPRGCLQRSGLGEALALRTHRLYSAGVESKIASPESRPPWWRSGAFRAARIALPLAAMWVILFSGWVFPRRHYVASYSRADHDKAVHRLAAAANGIERGYALLDAAKTTVYFGSLDEAHRYATELLAFVKEDAEKGRRVDGNQIHDGHEVLGLVALRQGRVEDAKKELLLAGGTPGSPHLDSFGPNMLLAKELLERGEASTVMQYFEACRRFWKLERGRLDRWTKDAQEGRAPDFGANLLY